MSIHLKNLAKYPLSIRFNSGKVLILSPAEESAAIEESEIKGNAKIEKLIRQGMLNIIAAKPNASGQKKKPAVRKRKK
jgi:hypothetical protein